MLGNAASPPAGALLARVADRSVITVGIAMTNKPLDTLQWALSEYKTDIDRDETTKIIESSAFRVSASGGIEIFLNGDWVEFGRTDLIDDIKTTFCGCSENDLAFIKSTKAKNNYGARFSKRGFFVVDSMTDG